MIRSSETVLPGHPDKFCDQVADAIVAECYRADPRAYCQVEMAVWADQVFLSGAFATRKPPARDPAEIVRAVGARVGFVPPNAVDARGYRVHDAICRHREDPRTWTDSVNDQCIAVGWAGYDDKVAYLPPEHFLAHRFAAVLARSCRNGRLAGHGPDGKLLVRMREGSDDWRLEHVLVTLQHLPCASPLELYGVIAAELGAAYAAARSSDPRWSVAFEDVELSINPNGPFLEGGSAGDNGQTGRKLVMDYYGPRVAIGGGALSGKDLAHVDRAAAYATRQAALEAVLAGAGECRVVAVYAPNRDAPLDVVYEAVRRSSRLPPEWFAMSAARRRYRGGGFVASLGTGGHFVDASLPWNTPVASSPANGLPGVLWRKFGE